MLCAPATAVFHLFSSKDTPPPTPAPTADPPTLGASTSADPPKDAATTEPGSSRTGPKMPTTATQQQKAVADEDTESEPVSAGEVEVTEVMPAGSPAPGTPASVFPTTGSFLKESETRRVDCYSEIEATEFLVRSKNYLSDHRKVSSPPALCKLVAADVLQSSRKIDAASALIGSVPKLTPTRQFVVFNWQVPSTPALSLVCYYVMPEHCVQESGVHSGLALLRRFLSKDESDDFRNVRFKLIPRVSEGPWIIKATVPNTPAIIGNKLTTTYHWGENWTEITIDVGSSVAASTIFSIVRSAVRSLVIDLAMVIQGNTEAELPEHILGTIRINHFSIGPEHIRVIPDD